MTTKTVRPANAGAITRTLANAGLLKSVFTRSSMVRGYGSASEGVTSEQLMEGTRRRVQRGTYADHSPRMVWESNNRPTGYVEVTYNLGSYARVSGDEALAKQRTMLTTAQAVLRDKGFEVSDIKHRGTGRLVFTVCRKDADGNVVRA